RAAGEVVRGAARRVLPEAHLQAHDDGLPARYREHAQRVCLFEGVLPAVVPPAVHDDHRRRRRDSRTGDAARRQVLGWLEAWRPGFEDSATGGDPDRGPVLRDSGYSARAAADRTEVCPRAMVERDAAL